MPLRKWVSIAIALIGLALGAAVASSGPLAEHSAENSRVMHRQFLSAAAEVERFRARAGRLPTVWEFEHLARAPGPYEVEFYPHGFADCDGNTERFQTIPAGTYVLAAWRGEWTDCFAPASGHNTLPLRTSDYFVSGSPIVDGGAIALIALLAAAGLLRFRAGQYSLLNRDARSS